MTKRRPIVLIALVASLAAAARDSHAGDSTHPHFDDQGTLTWFHTLGEAKAAARDQDKVILVEYGRLRCGQCRVLCSKVLPHCDVRARLSKIAVGLAANCDDPEPAVDQLLRSHLPKETLLPLVGFLHADGRWITGFGGGRTVELFLCDLGKAERALIEDRKARSTARPTTAAASPCPATGSPVAAAVVRTVPSAKARAEDAARQGAWGEVVRLCRAAGRTDPAMVSLEDRARTWAKTRLCAALAAIEARRFDEAKATVDAVRSAMDGEPEAADAARGLVAIRYARELGSLDPEDAARDTVRKNAQEELRGTRWERLFA